MKFLATEAVIPVRAEASESAEMISQMLFGELCIRIDSKGTHWWKVRLQDDGYEGWLNPAMLSQIQPEETALWERVGFIISGGVHLSDGSLLPLPLGARLPLNGLENKQVIRNGAEHWQADENLQWLAPQAPSELLPLSERFRNVPYLWGGRSGFGIDCSGFTQQVYRMCGIQLPRDSSQQALVGKEVQPGSEQRGDLAFFRKANRNNISHVGILNGKGQILHASGKVRQDPFTPQGILHKQTNELTHILVSIRRYL